MNLQNLGQKHAARILLLVIPGRRIAASYDAQLRI
jgi:hypothetical protein